MIQVKNLTKERIDEQLITGLAKKALKGENRKIEELSIVVIGEKRIRTLNRKYRKKDMPTDVLSFGNGLNEIFICPKRVKMNAKKYGVGYKEEFGKILVHGILHVLGYEHGEEMDKKQDYYIK